MQVACLTLGPYATNCYVMWNEAREALVIDPGNDAPAILDFIEDKGLRVAAYPLTHGHMDHVSALAEVHARHPAPVGLHEADAAWAFTELNRMPPFYETPAAPPAIERQYREAQEWVDAGASYRVLETPGHTPGSVSFYFENEGLLVVGDVLFRDSVGRTDLPGGDARALTASLRRLAELPDRVQVLPGHGPVTDLGREKRHNPFLARLN